MLSAATTGKRRGYACDLALAGTSLQKILADGDWRSEALRGYTAGIKDELHNRPLVEILGDNLEDGRWRNGKDRNRNRSGLVYMRSAPLP